MHFPIRDRFQLSQSRYIILVLFKFFVYIKFIKLDSSSCSKESLNTTPLEVVMTQILKRLTRMTLAWKVYSATDYYYYYY